MTQHQQTGQQVDPQRIVITGIGIVCALGAHPEAVYAHMQEATTGIRTVTRFETDSLQCSIAGQLEPATRMAIESDATTSAMDMCARYAVAAARQALHDSRLIPVHDGSFSEQGTIADQISRRRMGLTLGTCNGGILSLEKQWDLSALDDENTANYPFYQQGDDVAKALELQGPVTTINTACAASGNAIGYAYDLIRWGYADAMLAGGSDPLSHTVFAGFNVLRALSPEPSSPFSHRYGLNLGEGAAFVVLERMDRALERGAPIYGELCGYGLSNDAFHETAPHPEGEGIQRAIAMALSRAELSTQHIQYINAHGTGTEANDQAEVMGLKHVFGHNLSVPISSSKAYFGHNLGAAAAVELVTTLYAIRKGYIPATLHFAAPRPGCSDVDIVAGAMRAMKPSYILSNNAAFGGHNASLVVRTDGDQHAVNRSSSASSLKVVITGIGAVGSWGLSKGSVLEILRSSSLSETREASKSASFSLKEYDKSKYERRMNTLAQLTIGAAMAAIQDAELDEDTDGLGFIYGTSRGSTESIARFLSSVFDKGPEYASPIYFPHTVINSIAGKTAEKLQLKGFNSSLSTGGSEGLVSALYAAGMIREGALSSCLIGAGDERSSLSERIDQAKGLHASRYPMSEASVCLTLMEYKQARDSGVRIYGELLGFGIASAHSGEWAAPELELPIHLAIQDALKQANCAPSEIDLILLNSVGREGETEAEKEAIAQLGFAANAPVVCLNALFGYGESYSSMVHLAAAAEFVFRGNADSLISLLPLDNAATFPIRHVLTLSSSVNGNYVAAVVGQMEGHKGI